MFLTSAMQSDKHDGMNRPEANQPPRAEPSRAEPVCRPAPPDGLTDMKNSTYRPRGLSLLAAVALTAFAAGCGDRPRRAAEASPDAVLAALRTPAEIDLGGVIPGEVIPYEIIVENTSADTTAVINHISSSCGCTTTTPAPLSAPPGGIVSVKGAFSVDESLIVTNVGSLVHIGPDDSRRARVSIDGVILKPFPPTVARQAGAELEIPVHPRYQGRIRSCVAYADEAATTPIPGELSDAGDRFVIRPPAGVASVEIVLTLDRPDGTKFKVAQTVALTPGTFPDAGPETLKKEDES